MRHILCILLISEIFSRTDLYVGYSGKGSKNFNTVQEAVNEAASIKPSKEDDRVTIHIAPKTYRQQLVVNTPYITFINDEPLNGDVVLTFYYGIGYKYYSVNDKGFFDQALFEKKSQKKSGLRNWGATVHILEGGSYFKAQNIIFENSFNRYMTEEEIKDGVELSMETGILAVRTMNLDVKAKDSTERAAALSIEAGYAEFLNCKFYSSQDTLYTGGSPSYFKNCLIEGETDYIFGPGNAVFDRCELRWKGFSVNPKGGHITAAKSTGTGYLMYNCKVTKNKALSVKVGDFGRPWGVTAKVLYINTILEDSTTITNEGWGAMSGVQPETIEGFKEYGTKLANGAAVNTSQRKGHIISKQEAESIDIKKYMNDWTPSFL
jgi:pectin methylesterase-like acyl-CoA thioesterase